MAIHDDILAAVELYKAESEKFENFSWTECKTKCNISVVNQQYATEW